MIEIVSVGSSSSGNSYIIMAGGRTIILDVGLPAKKITAALEHLGTDPADVDAVLVTHEHTDHVKSVRAIARKCCSAHFYASRGTAESAANFQYVPEERLHIIRAGDRIEINLPAAGETAAAVALKTSGPLRPRPVWISAFALSHDAAEPTGFTVEAGGEKLAVVTDTGVITEGIYEAVRDADKIVFEANHDPEMLMFGEYPYPVKVRIKGDYGHLSNDYAGEALARILAYRRAMYGDRINETGNKPASENCGTEGCGTEECGAADARGTEPLRIMLAHLSFHNNMPLFAKQAVEAALSAAGFIKGTDYLLDVAAKEGLTFLP